VSSSTTSDAVASARDALDRHAWNEAFDLFQRADADADLGPEDLEALAEAAWWSAKSEAAIKARERAYQAYLDRGDESRAGRMALMLSTDHRQRLEGSVAEAWFRRAERHLDKDPDSAEHGYLVLRRATIASGEARLDDAIELAAGAVDIGAKEGDPNLQAHGLMEQGMNLVASGRVTEGLSLVDEATMAAVSGELSPMDTGIVYCNTISVCADLADYRRAGEWTEAARRWCERQAISGFPGICRVHRAEIIRLRGNWLEAEEEARQACTELSHYGLPGQAAAGFYEIAEIRLRMGDFTAAAEAVAQAHELGHSGQPAISLLRLAEGKADAARVAITRALEDEREPLYRARLLPAAVDVALVRDDVATARAAAEELDQIAHRFGSTALQAMAVTTRAAVELAGGQAEAAVGDAKLGWHLWQEIDAPYEAARARLLLGQAYASSGDPDAASMEIRAARSAFEKLGAIPDVRRADELAPREAAPEAERVSRTFIFTDIVRSTNLVEAIGDQAWENLVGWHDRTLRAAFAEHGGEEISHAGDGFFVAFEDPGAALTCAAAIQRSLADHRTSQGFAPQVRVGVHASDATQRGGDYGGRGVHEAARIGAIAEGGEILASLETVEAAGSGWEVSEPREVALKGISAPAKVVSVAWQSRGPGSAS